VLGAKSCPGVAQRSGRPPVVAWLLAVVLACPSLGLWPEPVRADPPPLIVPANAPKTPAAESPKLSSDEELEIEDEVTGQTVVARHNALLETSTFRLEAQEIKLNKNTGHAEASGEVKLTQKALRVLARKASYDAEKKAVSAEFVRMGKPPLYLEGRSLTGNATLAKITDGTLYFNEPDPYGLNIHANSVLYDPQSQDITLQGATFRIGQVPFMYLPSFTQKRTDKPPVSVQSRFGYRSDLGAYAQTTTFWTQNPVIQPGMLLDFYTKSGVLAGPALKYQYLADPDWMQDGTLESAYINYTGGAENDLLGNPVPKNRYFINWYDKSTINGLVDITNSMYWWSDSNVVQDFRQSQWQSNQYPDNYIEAVHREENSLVEGFVRYRPNDFELIDQRLPEVRFDYEPSPILQTGIYQEGQVSYVQLIQQNPVSNPTANITAVPDLHSNRFDAYYGWRRPITPASWLTFTPVIGTRITSYTDTLTGQSNFTRFLGQVGFDSEMRSYGVWSYSNPTWGIDGLRHVLRPVLMYRYIPNAQQGTGQIPVIDGSVFTPYAPVVDLNDTRNIDQLYNTNLIRYGVENILQTRAAGYSSRDLASFNIYNDVLLASQPGQTTWTNIWATAGLYPADWLHFDILTRFDPQALTLREIRTRTRLFDGDRWSVAFFTDNLQHLIDQYWLDVNYRISERYSVGGRWRYDQRLGYVTEQVYSLRQRWGNSWDITYEITYYRGTQTQNGIGFNVRFDLLAF
jgi:LPS-assembly protein